MKPIRNRAKSTKGRPVGIDLFAGAGGLSLGFEQAGFDVAAAVEIDPIHAATHKFNFPSCAVVCKSVADVTGDEIRAAAGLEDAAIDVVFGGAPCQGFSLIGYRSLEDPRNRLVYHFVRLVRELGAKYFVFENVKGLTLGKHRKFLDDVIAEFESSEYRVERNYRVLNAARFGVPQNRERLFLLGCRDGLRLPTYPAESGRATVWDAIRDLPNADDFEDLVQSDAVNVRYGRPSEYGSFLRGAKVDPFDFSHLRIFDPNILTSSSRTEHTEKSRRRFVATPPGKVEPVSRFLKLDRDGLSNTLRAGTASDRGAFTSPRPIHPVWARVITVREAARIHSYPDWFRFHVTKWHGFRQIGNSVPPLLGRAVASEVMRALGAQPSRPTRPQKLGSEAMLRFDMSKACEFFDVPFDTIPQRTRADQDSRVRRIGADDRQPELRLVDRG